MDKHDSTNKMYICKKAKKSDGIEVKELKRRYHHHAQSNYTSYQRTFQYTK